MAHMPFDQASYRAPKRPKRKKAKKKVAKKKAKKAKAKKKAKKPAKKKAKKKAKRAAKKRTAKTKPHREDFVGVPKPQAKPKCAWCKKKLRPEDPTICARKTCAPGTKRCKAFKHRCVETAGHIWGHGYHTDDTFGGRVPWELTAAEAKRAWKGR
jgi:hypothetical protein